MSLRYLIDTSAMLRVARHRAVADVVDPLVLQGSVAMCTPVLLEAMFAVKSKQYDQALAAYQQSMGSLALDAESCARSVEVQQMLARTGQHQTAGAVDLLIAACAETNGLTVLHYDRDYEAIAKVTGQPVKWVVPAGSVR